jgi:DNA-binding HxlR family transcriptional regulator
VGAPYYQFCPVAKAMELLDERWTMLLLREMLLGTEHFNDLRRGLPRMSPTLLSHRLDQLQRAGLIRRIAEGTDVRYVLTPAGDELRPVVEQLSAWGVRWIGELGDADLDPKLLLWDMHRNIDHSVVPAGRTVIALQFADARPTQQRWWLVIRDGDADVCDVDPGYDVSVEVRCSLRAMTRFWRGDIEWATMLHAGEATAIGPSDLQRALPSWFTRPGYSGVPRAYAVSAAG